jgi:dihydrofolate reductase
MSLDGFTADEQGGIGWSEPDDELFRFINDLERQVGTYLFGRRMYETMVYWETVVPSGESTSPEREFVQLWKGARKIVYSTTLAEVSSRTTEIRRAFDPVEVREMVAASDRDLSINGPTLAGQAFDAGLVDEVNLFVKPLVLGGGTSAFPAGFQGAFELVRVGRFDSGAVHLGYRLFD